MRKSKVPIMNTAISIPIAEKERLQRIAKERGMGLSEMFIEGANLLMGLPVAFLKEIDSAVETTGLDRGTIITNLILTYYAKDGAVIQELNKSDTFRLAFRFIGGELVRGDKLFNLVFDEHLAAVKDLHKRWEQNRKKKPRQGLLLNEKDEEILTSLATQMTEQRASV